MHATLHTAPTVERPTFVWIGIIIELITGIGAVPIGWQLIGDPTGKVIQLPQGWIEATPFGSYLIPGLYLMIVNGFGMLALALLSVRRHPLAPWLTGVLGVGLIIWIVVEILALPETMFLTWVILAFGFVLGFVALFWLRRTNQLVLW